MKTKNYRRCLKLIFALCMIVLLLTISNCGQRSTIKSQGKSIKLMLELHKTQTKVIRDLQEIDQLVIKKIDSLHQNE